jgi:hypothetical protein
MLSGVNKKTRLSLESLDDRIVPSSTSIKTVASSAPTQPITTTVTSGQVISETIGVSQNGPGTWIKIVTQDGPGQETVTTTTSYADGLQVTDLALITKNASTGVETSDHIITTATKSGSTTETKDYTYTSEANGVTLITEVETNSKGKQSTYTGVEVKTSSNGGTETTVVLTNGGGQTEEYITEKISVGNATVSDTTGTTFSDHAFTTITVKTTNS